MVDQPAPTEFGNTIRNLVIQEYIENTKMCIQFFGWVGAGLLIFGMVIIDGWLTRPYGIW
ncbi:MAG: hypothetical protein JGK04_25000 [Microcoleus sp. PH2017_39_LGB_O_B]|uniref:hypothetical protein n=1 Tax=Microcoleus sp. PH2017_39_LGB_O_B TaxID=2798849 RepID=UPI001D5EE396|nr:hypothetical protein [Microcoleus sp. PH2017_39_LGB_O_B]MCC3631593.1 hypothetical protein [Microcoleus sp. PH2017_39_LGB_O_B]